MFAELIDKIVGLADARQTFQKHDVPGGRSVIVRLPDGSIRELPVPPGDRKHVVSDLDSFVTLLDTEGAVNLAVFVTDGLPIRATGFYDADDRRDRVMLDINTSAAWKAFSYLSTHECTQKEVITFLRDELFDCVDPGLLPMFRSIDFARRSDGSSTIEHGRESLGVSVEQSVLSKRGKLPEVIDLDLNVFADEPFRHYRREVVCSIAIDTATQRIRLAPRADQATLAMRDALTFAACKIRESFSGGDVVVVIGTP
jgi:hypothetical protein